jgi:putative oxidoreductase
MARHLHERDPDQLNRRSVMNDLFLVGRIIFGGFFVFNGINHFLTFDPTVQYTAAKGIPLPEVAVLVATALLLIGGFSVLFGFLPEIGLACIALFLAVVSPLMHNFWDIGDPVQRMNEMGNFMRNIALFGGSLMMLAVPRPWPYSVERGQRRIAA